MGDASVVSQDTQMPQDPNMGMDNQMMQDPNMGADPGMDMGNEPNMMGNDTGMGMEDPMMGGEQNPERARKEIQKNIGKACADFRSYQGQDKEDLTKWVEGMLDSILDDSDAGIGDESEPEMGEEEPVPQMESVIFTKKQLNKINEEFGIENLSDKKDDTKKAEKVKSNKNNNNTPFNNPKLNQ